MLWDVKIKIVDIGAADSNDERCPCRKLSKLDCEIIGFDPNGKDTLPYTIYDGKKHTFRICNYGMTSSLYEPNTALLEKFQHLEELMRVIERKEVETKRLDDLVKDADFLKIDTQGAEFEILSNAKELLKKIVVIQVEVIFLPLYINQPRFAQIDSLLQDNGFFFHTFYGGGGRMFKPLIVDHSPWKFLNQILWADAIYIKNFMNFGSLPSEKLLKLAAILDVAYGSKDLANFALMEYDRKSNTNLSKEYLREIPFAIQ